MNHQEYRPETPDYRRLVRENLLLMLVYHAASWIVYITNINIDLEGMGTAVSRVPWGMFCEPFQNALVGLSVAMTVVFVFHYFGRLYSHRRWGKERIRR